MPDIETPSWKSRLQVDPAFPWWFQGWTMYAIGGAALTLCLIKSRK